MNKTEKRMKIFTLIMQVIIQAVLLFPWMNMGTWKCNVPEYLIKLAASGDGMSYIKKSLKPLGVLDGADEQMMVQILMLFICELVMVLVIQVIGIVNLILALSNHHKLLLDIMSLIAGCMISFLGADGAVFSDPLSQVYPFLLVVLLVINLIGANLSMRICFPSGAYSRLVLHGGRQYDPLCLYGGPLWKGKLEKASGIFGEVSERILYGPVEEF